MDVQQQAVSASPVDWIAGQVLLGDFVIERVLGEGGMGKVYLVKSQTTNMRFAVKRAKGLKEGDRRNFLAELQTWIDLPEHPNLVSCRFFRTVGDEVLIFAEYVEGGSLKEWIASRKLYAGGEDKALERMLDIAIQFAWGLHCVHELGLVHQDVKPANVMMANDAQVAVQGLRVRVTDFGLARATGGERPVSEVGRSILVSGGGYTPAYCSPEQAAGLKLDRRTDVWSWGVSVLEMFQGDVVWQSGRVAARVLEAYLEYNGEEVGIPALPVEVADLLKGCFREDPAQRWQSLEVVVQNLKEIYQTAIGSEYSRALCKIDRKTTPQVGVGERRGRDAVSWADPRELLERALQAEGRDPVEAAEIVARHVSSRRGQLAADVGVYDEVRRIYERLIKSGRKDLENDLAGICYNAANVHVTVDDVSGALVLYNRAIEIRERLVNVEGQRELANALASLYMVKANALRELGDNSTAIRLDDQAIEIWEKLVNVEGRRDLSDELARIYVNKANTIKDLGGNRSAVSLYDRAIEIWERLVNIEGQRDLADELAKIYANKATAVMNLGDNSAAVGLYDRAIEMIKQLVNVEGRRELANALASLYMNKSIAFMNLGDNRTAIGLYDRAIEIRERLVNIEGRRELADGLAMLYLNKANALKGLGDNPAAVGLYDRAIEMIKQLVNVEGRRELADGLAMLYLNKANALRSLGDNRSAVVLYDRAIVIWERLVNVEGRRELTGVLVRAKALHGGALVVLGDAEGGKREIREAMVVLRAEINRTDSADLKRVLDWAVKQLGDQ